jgi:hypothetical protein
VVEKILVYVKLAKETKELTNGILECVWIERTDEWAIYRDNTVIANGLRENEAFRLLEFLEGECGE